MQQVFDRKRDAWHQKMSHQVNKKQKIMSIYISYKVRESVQIISYKMLYIVKLAENASTSLYQ